jgi:hypothetical protein
MSDKFAKNLIGLFSGTCDNFNSEYLNSKYSTLLFNIFIVFPFFFVRAMFLPRKQPKLLFTVSPSFDQQSKYLVTMIHDKEAILQILVTIKAIF